MPRLTGFALAALLVTGGALPALGQNDAWETIAPGGETACATGTPYTFHAHRGDPDKLIVYFNGGGACWDAATCDVAGKPSYVPSAEAPHNDPRTQSGIFDFGNPANPVRDWSVLFVSYCTGDVHLGQKDVSYTRPDGSTLTIRHRGHINAHAALDWMKAHVAAPSQVLVTGSSAGSIAAPVYAGVVSKLYPQATIRQLGDGAGGYNSPEIPRLLQTWGTMDFLPAFARRADGSVESFNDFYVGAAAAFPNVTFAQYDAAHDAAQAQFQTLLGSDPDVFKHLQGNQTAIGAGVPNFTAFVAAGDTHTILRAPYFYTLSADGISFLDWFSAYVAGDKPAPVTCASAETGCEVAAQ